MYGDQYDCKLIDDCNQKCSYMCSAGDESF